LPDDLNYSRKGTKKVVHIATNQNVSFVHHTKKKEKNSLSTGITVGTTSNFPQSILSTTITGRIRA